MDIRSLANSMTSTINQNVDAVFYRSAGYTIGAGRKQVPSYDAPLDLKVQVQALDNKDLKQLDGLNLQGATKAIYVTGEVSGVVRSNGSGGDKFVIDGKTWLTVKVLEGWAEWTKVAVTLQDD